MSAKMLTGAGLASILLFACESPDNGTEVRNTDAMQRRDAAMRDATMRDAMRRSGQEPGTPSQQGDELQFARELWTAMGNYRDWPLASDVYAGRDPHGAFLRLYMTWLHVGGQGHPVVVKDNFTGANAEAVQADMDGTLQNITVMVQRADGYGSQHGGWYWVQYEPDGTVARGADGVPVAGQVAGCVRCHDRAEGHDYLFHNDRFAAAGDERGMGEDGQGQGQGQRRDVDRDPLRDRDRDRR